MTQPDINEVVEEWVGMSVPDVLERIKNTPSYYLGGTLTKTEWQKEWELLDNIKVTESPQIIFVTSPDHIDIVVYYLADGIPTSFYSCSSNKFNRVDRCWYPNKHLLTEFPFTSEIMNIGSDLNQEFSLYYILEQHSPLLNWINENPFEVKQ